MLAQDLQWVVLNSCGAQLEIIDVDLQIRYWKLDSNGALVYQATPDDLEPGAAIANDAYGDVGGNKDNASDKFFGGHAHLVVDTTGLTIDTDGHVELRMQRSTDGTGGNQDDDGNGKFIGAMDVVLTNTIYRKTFGFS